MASALSDFREQLLYKESTIPGNRCGSRATACNRNISWVFLVARVNDSRVSPTCDNYTKGFAGVAATSNASIAVSETPCVFDNGIDNSIMP